MSRSGARTDTKETKFKKIRETDLANNNEGGKGQDVPALPAPSNDSEHFSGTKGAKKPNNRNLKSKSNRSETILIKHYNNK